MSGVYQYRYVEYTLNFMLQKLKSGYLQGILKAPRKTVASGSNGGREAQLYG
jgi:hypothetical protein